MTRDMKALKWAEAEYEAALEELHLATTATPPSKPSTMRHRSQVALEARLRWLTCRNAMDHPGETT